MSFSNTFFLVLFVCAAAAFHADAFTVIPATRSSAAPSAFALRAGRRDFLDAAVSVAAGVLISSSIPGVAGAEDAEITDDLAMPSEEEQKKADAEAAAAAAERLRRKAELQKAASRPASFKESLEKEREKQKGLQMSKEERRNALCEELGRGC